jgi:hypothetical protein
VIFVWISFRKLNKQNLEIEENSTNEKVQWINEEDFVIQCSSEE